MSLKNAIVFFFVGFCIALASPSSKAQAISFRFSETITHDDWALRLIQGDWEGTSIHHTTNSARLTIECVSAGCKELKISYLDINAYEAQEFFVKSDKFLQIIRDNKPIVKRKSETVRALKNSFETAVNIDLAGTGIFLPLTAFLAIVNAPIGLAQDIYNVCRGDGSCKLDLKAALEKLMKLKGNAQASAQISMSEGKMRDLIALVSTVGRQIGETSIAALNGNTCGRVYIQ